MLAKLYTAALLVLSLLIVSASATAATTINKLDLEKDGGFTVLTIQGDGQLRYAHESVEAKEGKPFRIVVDCLASRHNLPQFHFNELPQSIVSSIRTSQYSVAPEEVVRVVLDLSAESVYRVEPTGNAVRVYVSDQKSAPFDSWTSGIKPAPSESSPEPKQVAQAAAKPQPKAKETPSKPVHKSKPAKPSTEIAALPTPDNNKKPAEAPAKPVVKTEKPAPKPQPPVVEKQSEKKAVPAKELANDSIQRAKAFAAMQQKAKPQPKPSTEQKPVKKKAEAESPKKEAAPEPKKATEVKKPESPTPKPAVPSPVADDKETELADADTGTEPEKVDISRYRRSKAKEAEMKASQVVEFPKRMVIKYKKTNPRDPFESLIALNDKDKKRNIDLNQIPNIETLHLVGVLESVLGKDAALLEDRDGIGYILRAGDRVKNGYVAQIDKNAVYFQLNEYGWSRTVVKHMENEN